VSRKPSPAILWIDDSQVFRLLGKTYLENELQVEVDFAATLATALQKLKLVDYDLVITDLLLPDSRGGERVFGLIEDLRNGRLKGLKPSENIPFIIVSLAHDMASHFAEHDASHRTYTFPKDMVPDRGGLASFIRRILDETNS
jgi:CheY-like chemotaxis protein